jgi:ferredoxin-NADP reductase
LSKEFGKEMRFDTTVMDIILRTIGVKSFRFERPADFEFDPGQWMFITILINGEQKTKHFTISSSPTEKEFLEFTKKITDHEFSVALDRLGKGDWARIDGPYGEFTFKGEYPKVGMLTGGIGITPLRSMIRYCTDTHVPSKITLLYGNRNEESIVYYKELEEMKNHNPDLTVVHCLSRPSEAWKGRRRHVDQAAIQEAIADYRERMFFICGPPPLVTSLVQVLGTLGIPESCIKIEHFPGY